MILSLLGAITVDFVEELGQGSAGLFSQMPDSFWKGFLK